MPFFWRPYRRRFRRYWKRRPRRSFRRRRLWRTKRYRVRRKRKLTKLTIKQWQPNTIKKLNIKGQYPLFCGTTERIANDYISYIDSIAPHDFPGGGLFSIMIFTLNGLFELHQKSRNWWTKSNCNLPLVRYLGCSIKLYPSSSVDYITVPINCGELSATEQTFQSCQPSVLHLNKKKRVLLCKNFKHGKKPYKKLFVKPPAILLNKWYFQKEICKFPLLMLLTSAASMDRYFCSASSVSETIGFQCLNTTYFQLHGFKTITTQPYTPNTDFALFAIGNKLKTFETAQVQDLILLGNPKDYQQGQIIGTDNQWSTHVDNYMSKTTNWGNPFMPYYLLSPIDEGMLCHLNITNTTVAQKLKTLQATSNVKEHFQKPSKPFILECRYNPQQDMGHNAIFLTRIQNDMQPWHKPSDDALIQQGLPLWLLYWGWHDYIAKAKIIQNQDTDYINVIVSDYIHETPKQTNMTYYVPLDWFMLHARSPYAQADEIKGYDLQNWHPKANFQIQSIAHICQSGPATAKLPPLVSAEAHMSYNFHFKVGGCPPKMDEVCNPCTQPYIPQPGNLLSSILLQNPEYPIQYYISSFDQRRDILTQRAAKRIKEDTGFKESILKPTGSTLMQVQVKAPQETLSETSDEEETEKTLESELHKQRRVQRKLQFRILQLLEQLQTT
nr:MAG: ORF1 [TTV-like mini virus]